MKKVVLTAVVGFMMLWLSGCMVVECEDYGPPEEVCVVPVPPPPPVEVIYVPGPPRPYHHHYGPPHRWHR